MKNKHWAYSIWAKTAGWIILAASACMTFVLILGIIFLQVNDFYSKSFKEAEKGVLLSFTSINDDSLRVMNEVSDGNTEQIREYYADTNIGFKVVNSKGDIVFENHNFTNDDCMNNGLDIESGIADDGRSKVTGALADKGKFKVPSLRNIAQSFPYMHDGRFKTLEEVIDHYNTGVKPSNSVDILLQYNLQPGGLKLNATDKADLVAFLKTLTDETYLKNEAFKNPF